MRKIALALAALLLLQPAAYAQKTKSNMTTEINTNLPDNTTGLITPSILRSTLIDMVNSWYGLIDATNPGTSASTFQQLNLNGVTSGVVTIQPQANAGTWNFNLPTTAGTAGQVLTSQGGGSNVMTWSTVVAPFSGQTITATPANPTGTTSTTLVMMGLGSTCTLTPNKSTRVFFTLQGQYTNTGAGAVVFQLKFGTGTAPANGAAATGTNIGNVQANGPAASVNFASTSSGVVTGLTVSTAYWFDVALDNNGAGTAAVANITCTAFEL